MGKEDLSFVDQINDWCNGNKGVCILIVIIFLLHCSGNLMPLLNKGLGSLGSLGFENFELNDIISDTNNSATNIQAAEEKKQSGPLEVDGLGRTPSSCYPQQTLKPEDLLPTDENKAITEFNISKPIGEGILQGVNLLDSTYHVGVNTIGQSLRNANRQIRSEPPNPQVNVSPWMMSTIGPDLPRKPLELNESCPINSDGPPGLPVA